MQQHQPRISPHYDDDFFAWTQHQANLLRTITRLRVELPAELDLDHVAEEIESLGSAELNAVKSLIRQIMVHLIKAASDPRADALAHWRTEATTFHIDMLDHYLPSMRQLLDMDQLWKRARLIADLKLNEQGLEIGAAIPEDSPFSLEDMTAAEFKYDEALKKLSLTQAAG